MLIQRIPAAERFQMPSVAIEAKRYYHRDLKLLQRSGRCIFNEPPRSAVLETPGIPIKTQPPFSSGCTYLQRSPRYRRVPGRRHRRMNQKNEARPRVSTRETSRRHEFPHRTSFFPPVGRDSGLLSMRGAHGPGRPSRSRLQSVQSPR